MLLQFTFVMRWNLAMGIPDIAMAISLNIFKPLKNVTIQIMLAVIFARISPHAVEAAAYSFYSGWVNLC
jgi:hypothetical protein